MKCFLSLRERHHALVAGAHDELISTNTFPELGRHGLLDATP
jgi:hypothetical protein